MLSVKCPLSKHEDLCPVSRTHIKKPGVAQAFVILELRMQRAETVDYHLTSQLSLLGGWQASERPCLRK